MRQNIPMYSRVRLIQELPDTSRMNAMLQDSYDIQDELEEMPEPPSNAPSIDNFYDAQGIREPVPGQERERSVGPTSTSLPEVRINMHPTERLIEAMESLREVILDNTNAQQKQRRRGGGRGGGGGGGIPPGISNMCKSNGTVMNLKDERLKIRRDKVSTGKFICDYCMLHINHVSYTDCIAVLCQTTAHECPLGLNNAFIHPWGTGHRGCHAVPFLHGHPFTCFICSL